MMPLAFVWPGGAVGSLTVWIASTSAPSKSMPTRPVASSIRHWPYFMLV